MRNGIVVEVQHAEIGCSAEVDGRELVGGEIEGFEFLECGGD